MKAEIKGLMYSRISNKTTVEIEIDGNEAEHIEQCLKVILLMSPLKDTRKNEALMPTDISGFCAVNWQA